MILGDESFTKHKNRVKRIRTFFEILAVIAALVSLYLLFFHVKTYRPFKDSDVSHTTDTGFIALSYFGVDRIGDTSTLIGKKQLREHLEALKDEGYVTITHDDILKYYKEGKPLPPKSLYLMFEDGRRDTALFADEILEDLNFKGVMMTYPEKFNHEDTKFLRPIELKDMEDSSYWEMGTNGYRLEYINVFDRYHHFIGEIDPLKYAMMQKSLGRDYNHYLMDFIRDKDRIPVETVDHMKRRIAYDYRELRDIYSDKLGYVPPVYVLMHSNTGHFGNAPSVSAENEKWIRSLFEMNFNREGYCFNQRNSSLYDLTRMQPQPYWPVNHLLMRIKYDTNRDLRFKTGDDRIRSWDILKGAAQFKGESLIVTSIPEKAGIVKLKGNTGRSDVDVHVRLEGNSFGDQKVLLRGNKDLTRCLAVGISQGKLEVEEVEESSTKKLFSEKLSVLDGQPPISVEEDEHNVRVNELETLACYADSTAMANEYMSRLARVKQEKPKTIEEGGKPYEPVESFHARLDRTLDISLDGSSLTVLLDGKEAARVDVGHSEDTDIGLFAGWDSRAFSQRNLADDVYDGVFEKLVITSHGQTDGTPLYTTELKGFEKWKFVINQKWESVLGWFLRHF